MESGTFRTGPDGMPTRVDVKAEARERSAKAVEDGQLVIASLVGATVVGARCYDANPDDEWAEGERYELTLSDGRIVTFSGYGYDSHGAAVHVSSG